MCMIYIIHIYVNYVFKRYNVCASLHLKHFHAPLSCVFVAHFVQLTFQALGIHERREISFKTWCAI